jgi:hypothetical protein
MFYGIYFILQVFGLMTEMTMTVEVAPDQVSEVQVG